MKCVMCKDDIRMMIYKGTGVCCDNCRKDRDGDDDDSARH